MKFVIAVVLLVLAVGAQSSVLSWPYAAHGHGLSYTAVSGPAVWPAHGLHAAHDLHGIHGYHGGHVIHAAPAIHAAYGVHHAAPAHLHAPAHLAHEGTYVAETRGAVHTAPLPGHINSAAAINVAPAPGTTW